MTESLARPPGRVTWLVLVYRLPPGKPGALAVAVRRRLTRVGAVYLAKAVAAVPECAAAQRVLRRLCSQISDAGGSAEVLRAEAIDGELDMIAAYNAARDQEYREIITQCRDAVAVIEDLAESGHFRFAQLWEKDKELKQISARYDAIREQDSLGASEASAAGSALARYRAVLDDHSARVYETEDRLWPGVSRFPAASCAIKLDGNGGGARRETRKCRQRSLPDDMAEAGAA
jgi:hypothetical protein